MATKTQYFPLGGGLDIVSPAVSLNPGRALFMLNFEPWFNGGYQRIAGYERFDGRPKPSDASFQAMQLDTVAGLSVGDTVTGDTSAATGVVAYIDSGLSVIAVTKITGTFQDPEDLDTSTYTIEELYDVDKMNETDNAYYREKQNIYRNAAETIYRDDITTVTGSGNVLGVHQLGATTYAVRDNAGDTAGVLFKASASGWTTTGVTMAEYIFFDAGTANGPFEEGDTVTGVTSGATATVHRMVLHSGSWSGDAAGYLVLTSVASGPFQNNEALQVSAATVATSDGANTAFAFSNDGDYRFINHNYFGSSTSYRAYGVNGVDPAFEIDENGVVSPILFPQTAAADQPASNIPFLIEEHRNYLFLGFPGGSLQHSVLGEPLNFNGFLGAAEFGIGDELTSLNSVTGSVLVITSERETRGLYGLDTTDWELKVLDDNTGAMLNTSQKLDTVYSLNNIGITSLARTDVFGGFVGASVSQLIQPLLSELLTNINCSTIVRKSNQYRLYFSDKTVIVMYVPDVGSFNQSIAMQTRKSVEFGVLLYGMEVIRSYNCTDENGDEIIFLTSDDGYVYQDQIGRNFDGTNIESTMRLPFNHIGSPAYRKYFRRADLEISTNSVLDLTLGAELDYGTRDNTRSNTTTTLDTESQDLVLAKYGEDEYYWGVDDPDVVTNELWYRTLFSGKFPVPVRMELSGTANNISFIIANTSRVADPWTMHGITIHYDSRRLGR